MSELLLHMKTLFEVGKLKSARLYRQHRQRVKM